MYALSAHLDIFHSTLAQILSSCRAGVVPAEISEGSPPATESTELLTNS